MTTDGTQLASYDSLPSCQLHGRRGCEWSCWLIRLIAERRAPDGILTAFGAPLRARVGDVRIGERLREHAVRSDDCAKWVQLMTARNHPYYGKAFNALPQKGIPAHSIKQEPGRLAYWFCCYGIRMDIL